ncbi:TPA: toll/interleukin-1 receptor domain-containing protein [Vibrio parahaemolyticus]|nr:toll/interleukin-1 receptor domain-containing protein [Vibrio parahaemolyticus]HCG5839729.1 toll/interleukin-1 receptor domain-containing protein [Vibrio parahaemolyticus]HCM0477663.1 toll/interleukin-1 receptor domain-containing protein [Vibrio parahaemolyticus]
MDKPTIFFSHSSVDKDYISYLHKKVTLTTARTVEVFQSSDGESIPFGNNWVHKIEENLHKAKIMFVFVSPSSLSSSWIYFESGFAYSRGVKVIPIGIKGVDVGSLKPPLNLLQGFNINSENGMNNIITVLNREFGCEYPESYTESDFIELSNFDENVSSEDFMLIEKVDYVSFKFPDNLVTSNEPKEGISLCGSPLNVIADRLGELGIEAGFGGDTTLYSHGLIATYSGRKDSELKIKIDPFILSTYVDFLNHVSDDLYGSSRISKIWCNLVFNSDVSMETTDFKVSSRLYTVGVRQSGLHGGYFKFEGLDFTIEPEDTERYSYRDEKNENVRVIFDKGSFSASKILSLISKLVESKVVR